MDEKRTGGGPPEYPPLLPLEQKLLNMMGQIAVEGNKEILELGFGQVITHLK